LSAFVYTLQDKPLRVGYIKTLINRTIDKGMPTALTMARIKINANSPAHIRNMNDCANLGANQYAPYMATAQETDTPLMRSLVRQVCSYISDRYTVPNQRAPSRITDGYSMAADLTFTMSQVQRQYQSHRNGYEPSSEMLEALTTLSDRGVFTIDGDSVRILV
jgi:hypothetical protein